MKNLPEWNIYHPLLNHVAPTSGHVHNWAVNIFLPGLLIRIFMSSNDLSKYVSLLPSHMLHIATCVFIIRWHGDRVIVALFHFCQNNTSLLIHNQIRVSSIGKRMLKKLHVMQSDPSTNPKTIKSKKKVQQRSYLPLAPSSMVMNDPVKRYGGILASPSPPRLPPFISLPCLFNTLNLFQHFSKLQIYIFCRTTWRKIHTRFYDERDNDDGDGTDDTS